MDLLTAEALETGQVDSALFIERRRQRARISGQPGNMAPDEVHDRIRRSQKWGLFKPGDEGVNSICLRQRL